MGLFSGLIKLVFGDPQEKKLKPYWIRVEEVNALEDHIKVLTDDQLKGKTETFRQQLSEGASLDTLLPEAFAVVREASKRVLGMRHFDVQILGGIILHEGKISEMKTGEGKTLVSTLPAYLNALQGQGVYVVTVNDYLAKRDSEWMGQLFEFLGVSVGLIQSGMPPQQRIEEYAKDIVYGTNNEFGFDYLRDNLAHDIRQCCQTRRHFAIVDEVDSILIDEARTPLIISGQLDDNTSKYKKVTKVVKALQKDVHFTLDEKHRNVVMTEAGNEEAEKLLGIDNIYSMEHMDVAHMVTQGIRALHLYKRDVDYVVKDGQVIIVDEFTGRLMDGRRYSDGLHQSIESLEGLKIQNESQTLASITFQNYFRMFPKLAGMTGTAITEQAEFFKIYGLEVVVMPTNKPIQRQDLADIVYKSREEKFNAITREAKQAYETGQPVLIGTITIEASEYLSNKLKKEGIPHKVLNAKYHEQEAEIISQAGQLKHITIATNMAGRGTDIVLGEGARELGGLYVMGSERHESRRIDNQLRGRSGRQGDPGKSRFYVALDDDLMRMFGSDRIARVMDTLGLPPDTPIEHGMITKSIERAQTKVEKYHFGVRKQILEYDDVMNKQRENIYSIRRQFLELKGVPTRIKGMIDDFIKARLDEFFGEEVSLEKGDKDGFYQRLQTVFPMSELQSRTQHLNRGELATTLSNMFKEFYDSRRGKMPVDMFEAVVVRQVFLQTLDRKWIDHQNSMESLREGIGLRAYGQRDPLIEYKMEAFDMYNELMDGINEETLTIVNHVQIVEKETIK